MTRRPTMTLVIKEARALALPWLVGLAVLLFSLISGRWRHLAWLTYFLSAAIVGGLSVGHEYNDRTLDWLLAQPVRRARLFAIKQAVLAVMLLVLSGVAVPLLLDGGAPPKTEAGMALAFTFFAALFIAPHLTMVCRNALAGAVFTAAIPGMSMTAGALMGALMYGFDAAEIYPFQIEFMKWGMVMQCAISAVMSWRSFINLESIGGTRQFQAPSWLRRDTAPGRMPARVTRHPVWALVKKELRLQPMTFFFAGLYIVGWISAIAASRVLPEALQIFKVLTIFYAGLTALLVGALASAEERLLGTLEWQLLLPIASRTQWLIKVSVAVGLALALAWGLPMLVLQATRQMSAMGLEGRVDLPLTQPIFVGFLVVLTASGLYASSVATSGLRAFLLSIPGLYAAGLTVTVLIDHVGPAVYAMVRARAMEPGSLFVQRIAQVPPLFVGAAFAALVLTFALTNHRSADRPSGRITKQMTWLTASIAFGAVAVAVVSSF